MLGGHQLDVGAPGHCDGCGRPVGDCGGCRRALDPPRFCVRCGQRLRVLVIPTGFEATCRRCGTTSTGS